MMDEKRNSVVPQQKKIEELFYTLESIQDKSEREELIKKLTDAIKERNSTVSYMKRR